MNEPRIAVFVGVLSTRIWTHAPEAQLTFELQSNCVHASLVWDGIGWRDFAVVAVENATIERAVRVAESVCLELAAIGKRARGEVRSG